MTIGASAHYRRVLLQADFDRFAALSGDDNPIHCDPDFAARSHFGATVAHGMLLYGCISKALSELMPGPGVVQLEQSLKFTHPTYANEPITVKLEVLGEVAGVLDIATAVTKAGADGAELLAAGGQARVVPAGVNFPAVPASEESLEAGDDALYGMRPGMQASTERVFSNSDLEAYCDLTGDRNPVFRDERAAQARGLARRIVPGPLLAGMFSGLLGTRLPGRGTGWMKQTLRFLSPAYPGERLRATVEVTRLRAAKELVNLATRIAGGDGRRVCDGEALVLVRNLESKQR